MKLRCIKTYAFHYGIAFQEGKEYEVLDFIEKEISVITNYEKYWACNTNLLEHHRNYVKRMKDLAISNKLTDSDKVTFLKEQKEIVNEKSLYETIISLPHLVIKSDRDTLWEFLITTDKELFKLGVDKNKKGRPSIGPITVYRIDEFFDYIVERRDRKLKELGI